MEINYLRTCRAIKKILFSESIYIVAILIGLALRFYQISTQILGEDEWHALHALTAKSFAYILTHFSAFGLADYSIPLTFIYKLLALTFGLSELGMRFPSLFFGACSLVLFPLLVRSFVSKPISLTFAWLLAISPTLIYFSRYARPYAISTFLAFIGILAFYKWWAEKRKIMLGVYIICAIFGPYFHLTIMPFVFAPLLFVAMGNFRVNINRRISFMVLCKIGLSVIIGLLVLLILPLAFNLQSLQGKTSYSSISWDTLMGAMELMVGAKEPWLLITALLLGLVIGSTALFKKNKLFFSYLLFLTLCQVSAVFIARPKWSNASFVFLRYCLPCLPVFLLMLASGLTQMNQGIKLKLFKIYPFSIIFILLLFFFGPLIETYYRPNQWTNHQIFQYNYHIKENFNINKISAETISPFYSMLRDLPKEKILVVETPWDFPWIYAPYVYYQRIHRQTMGIGFVKEICDYGPPGEFSKKYHGLYFKYFFHLSSPDLLVARKVKYLIIHKDLKKEMQNNGMFIQPWKTFSSDITPLIEFYKKEFGRPFFEDKDIVVFETS